MKNKFIILIVFCLSIGLQAQQLRYVDTDYILSKFPQYEQAKQRLEQQVSAWKSEIENDQNEIDELERSLENESVILTTQKIEERESIINSKKEKLNQKIEQKFGINGESQKLRVNLVKPLQDQIWNAIATVAKSKGYHMIFDKSVRSNLIYADEKYDITEMVIKELGLDKVQPTTTPKPQTRPSSIKGKSSGKIERGLEDKKEEKVKN